MDRLDEDKLEMLRTWGEGLLDDGRDELRAAGRAISMLVEEIESLYVDLWHARQDAAKETAMQRAESYNSRGSLVWLSSGGSGLFAVAVCRARAMSDVVLDSFTHRREAAARAIYERMSHMHPQTPGAANAHATPCSLSSLRGSFGHRPQRLQGEPVSRRQSVRSARRRQARLCLAPLM
jgi:hypothetical protein